MKLPSVFANNIDNRRDNNEKVFHNELRKKKDISSLKDFFDKNGYADKLLVTISTISGTRKEKLILYKGDYVININNEKIYLRDILDYNVEE